jgi:hypothetical protein
VHADDLPILICPNGTLLKALIPVEVDYVAVSDEDRIRPGADEYAPQHLWKR